MPQLPFDITNPGVVNVSDQGDGLTTVDQAVQVSPSSNPATAYSVIAPGGVGGSPSTSTNPDLVDVADQSYGTGLPSNVLVP